MTKREDLKPCPFCGGEKIGALMPTEEKLQFAVFCSDCGASSRIFTSKCFAERDRDWETDTASNPRA